MLIEMVNQHLIVHDQDNGDQGVYNGQRYFVSRSGAPVYVKELALTPIVWATAWLFRAVSSCGVTACSA